MDPVGLAAHRVGGDIVGDDPVASLAVELRPRMVDHVVGLGGKADQQRGALRALSEAGKNIGILGERERGHPPTTLLIDLLTGGGLSRTSWRERGCQEV